MFPVEVADKVFRIIYADTDAVVKEILRLYPPGGTARMAPKGSGTTLTMPDGKQLLVDGMTLAPMAKLIQRDPAIFGDTKDDFAPERWLGQHKIPDSAWRPYERGPRRCTGSELANMEARLILACTARRYDFVKVGDGELDLDENGKPILDDKGCYKTKSTLFTVSLLANLLVPSEAKLAYFVFFSLQTTYVTAKPLDGMMMKVKWSEKAQAKA